MLVNFDNKSSHCRICGSTKLHKFRATAHDALHAFVNIVECRKCLFAWQYPMGRSEEDSATFFKNAYKNKRQSNSNRDTDYFNEKKKREIAKLEFDFISSLPGEKSNLLDIGAGAGIFAEISAENNLSVTAIDPAIDIERFKTRHRIQAIKGKAEDIPKGKLFDIITLWDVIEHATNPILLIELAYKHLKKGGWLVLETGNYKSASRINDGPNHWIYQLDHRWYFSPDSLKLILQKNFGFSDFIFCEKVLRPSWEGTKKYSGPSRLNFVKDVIKNPLYLPNYISKYIWLTISKKWEMGGLEIFAMAARKG